MCFPLQDCPSISSRSSTIDLPLCLDKPSLTAGSQPLTPCLREPGFLLKDGLLPSIVAEQTASWQPPRTSALSVREESSHVVPGLRGLFRVQWKGAPLKIGTGRSESARNPGLEDPLQSYHQELGQD